MPDKISWRRILVEGLVIVVSILLAFGIEAWWQERGDRTAELEALVGLHAEFTAIRERLEGDTLFRGELAGVEDLYERVQALPLDGGTLSAPDIMLVQIPRRNSTLCWKFGALVFNSKKNGPTAICGPTAPSPTNTGSESGFAFSSNRWPQAAR